MTDSPSALHVVFGAGGPLGKAVVRRLAKSGARVRAVARSPLTTLPPGVQTLRAGACDVSSARSACAGASVVYHTANAPYHRWPELLPPMMDGLIDAARSSGAKLVYADNLYAYGAVDGPLVETLPMRAAGKKGRTRAIVSQKLLDAHETGAIRGVIARGSDFFGPEVLLSAVGERLFAAALGSKSVDWIGDPDQPHTFTFIDDFAEALITLGADERLGRGVWHVPSAEAITARQFIAIVSTLQSRPLKVRVLPPWLLALMGLVNPTLRELKEVLYQFTQPFVLDSSKYQAAFSQKPTPYSESIARSLSWYRGVSEHAA